MIPTARSCITTSASRAMSSRRSRGTRTRCMDCAGAQATKSSGDVGSGARGTPKWMKRTLAAAIKAPAFFPWSLSLESGGGTSDTRIHRGAGDGGALEMVKIRGFPGSKNVWWGIPLPFPRLALGQAKTQTWCLAPDDNDAHAHAHTKIIRDLRRSQLAVLFSALSLNGKSS